LGEISLDAPALLFALAISLLSGALFSVHPNVQICRTTHLAARCSMAAALSAKAGTSSRPPTHWWSSKLALALVSSGRRRAC